MLKNLKKKILNFLFGEKEVPKKKIKKKLNTKRNKYGFPVRHDR